MNTHRWDLLDNFEAVRSGFAGLDYPHNDEVEAGERHAVVKLNPQWPYCDEKPTHRILGHMSFVIEKNIPPTRIRTGRPAVITGEIAATMERLEPGESFLIPCEGEKKKIAQMQIAVGVVKSKFHTGKNFITRRDGDGLRVWRLQ